MQAERLEVDVSDGWASGVSRVTGAAPARVEPGELVVGGAGEAAWPATQPPFGILTLAPSR